MAAVGLLKRHGQTRWSVTFYVEADGKHWKCPPILTVDWNEARDIVRSWADYAAAYKDSKKAEG
jgi:hypothetical protein